MISNVVSPVIGAKIARKRRGIFDALRKAGSVSPSSAKTLSDIGIQSSGLFRRQVSRKIIIEAGNDRFYLDEIREKEIERFRHKILIVVITISFLFIAIAVGFRFLL